MEIDDVIIRANEICPPLGKERGQVSTFDITLSECMGSGLEI